MRYSAKLLFSIFPECASASRSVGRFGLTWINVMFATIWSKFWRGKKIQEMFWWLLHLRVNIGQRSDTKSVNWSRTGRPILRGGARLLSTRRGAFVMKGAREQRLLWLPRTSAATLCGKEHVVGFCAVNFTPNLHSPAQGETIIRSTRFCRASVSYSILRKHVCFGGKSQ